MLSNYLKIAWRGLLKNRLFTFLNLLGLATGLAVALLLMLYVKDELLFDTYHAKADRIYRVGLTATFDGKSMNWGNAPNAVGPALKANVPAVEQQARFLRHNFGQTAFVKSGDKKFAETNFYWADGSLFDIFDVALIQGNPKTVLDGPHKVVVSQATAERYFGSDNPIGKTLYVDNKDTLQVTGVYRNFPSTSTIDADMIGSFSSMHWAQNPSWSNASFETYILLRQQAQQAQVERQLAGLVDKHVPKAEQWYKIWLQPLTGVHLHSADMTNTNTTRIGDLRQVKILLILAVVILLIASINYMNLATAKAQIRFREVGVIKTIGASARHLISRFYLETGLMVTLALILAIGLVVVGLPLFNQMTDKHIPFMALLTPEVVVGLLLIGLLITLIAGSYPAFYLSSFSPKYLLSTSFRNQSGAGMLRRSLVVIQFAASIILMVCTFIFYQQLQFIQAQKLGYEPTQVVAVMTSAAKDVSQIDALMNDYRSLSSVVDVCRAQTFPGRGGSGRTISRSGNAGNTHEGMAIQTNRVSNEFMNVLGLKLLAGRTLPATKDAKDTTVQVVLNKTAVNYLGLTPQNAIGQKARNLFGEGQAEIIGVVDDFHFQSFHTPIGAYAFHNADTESRPYLLVKTHTTQLSQTMRQLEAVFQKDMPDSAFEYTFLDEFLNTLYRSEQRTAQVVLVFSALAILIACLGLFGLAAFTAEQRTKEIGVRKVLGASVSSIMLLLSKDFLKPVLTAILIASPIAWYAATQWLQGFAYKTPVAWWIFALAGATAAGVALLTVSFQSIKAALVNPVKSLRSE
ncbi:putative ABC transport system permease protein [Spirosoma oryzae]|uniref:Putative ABC transport system permease protein n=1 Tax=Spirosoma oryzae TaxID=1469603 RepID=A0A2T0T5X3_9BACT|nr:ABC transporter permease [Spirosoma oryzae]PRY41075.1 putative ABC transport system permease protein [Spirosoma oryzae]